MQSPFDLNGKIFLVTGASSGLGFEICKAIDQQKGKFIAVARREENLKELINQCNGTEHKYIVADLTVNNDLDNIVNDIDKIDGLVHSAGAAKVVPLRFYSFEVFDELQKLNVTSVMYLLNSICKKKKLNKNSSIVLLSSLAAYLGTIGGGFYSAVKAELIALSKVWANELSGQGTRVNCVAPGIVETDMVAGVYENFTPEEIAADKKKYPLGYGIPSYVAHPVAFLLSDASKWITGQTIILDGGRSIFV